MSLSDLDVKAKFNGNGVTVSFAIPFAHISDDSAETKVYLVDESVDPVTETLQTEGALQDYTLTGANPPTTPFDTHVTFNSAPSSAYKVLIIRQLAITQPSDLNATQNVDLGAIELAIDRVVAQVQELDEKIQRTAKFRKSYTTVTDPLMPQPSAGQYLRWNTDEDGLENATPVLSTGGGTIGLPVSSTDNAIVRWDGTDASTVQDSGATVSDAGVISAAGLLATGLTASRAVVTDGSKNLASSATTATELGYVQGVTSAIQTQLDGKQTTGNYITALTSDVTASGPGSAAATIANDAVTNAKMANMSQATIKGRASGAGTGDPADLTGTQATAILDGFVGDSGSGGVKGLVPAPATGDASKYLKGDGTWSAVAGGGGGGGSLSWIERANSPTYDSTNDVDSYIYADAMAQYLYTQVRVPNSYTTGNQIQLRIPFYSGLNSGTVLMQSLATLIRTGTDTISSTTNQRTSTNSAVTLSAGTVDEPQDVVCDLTDSSGQINSVAVSANDIIKVRITRNTGTDTAAGDVYVMPYAAEVTFS